MTDLALPLARRLRRGDFLRLTRPRRVCVRAEQGVLWATVDGRLDDIELHPGDSQVFDGSATVLISAIGRGAVLTATALPTAPSWRERLARWWRSPAVVALRA